MVGRMQAQRDLQNGQIEPEIGTARRVMALQCDRMGEGEISVVYGANTVSRAERAGPSGTIRGSFSAY